MKRLLSKVSLARLAVAVWLAWLATIVITAWLSLSGVLHPSFLYMAIPLTLMLFCTLGLVLSGIWRIVRGPGRYRALVLILVGVLPGILTVAYVEHLFLLAAGGGIRLTWPVRASTAVASLLAEPYVRTCYPHHHEGRRCVMWSASSERKEALLAQMDAHIEHMETLLGERSNDKAYWVRGPVWGLGGRYGVGWVLGSVAREQHYDWLDRVGRHEAAHFALNQLLPPDHQLPALFQEGWAELYTGGGGTSDWREFWLNLRKGKSLSLRELLNRDSYYRAEVPTYQQGCVLVDHLLRRFGHAKFLEFCRTCREATFDEDLQRVFGLSLDELDKSYTQELAQYNSVTQWYFMSLQLAEGVDPDQWRQLIEDYCEGTQRLQMAFRQSSVRVRETSEILGPDEGSCSDQCENLHFYRDGERNATINGDRNAGPCNVGIATSLVYFAVVKEKAGVPWRLLYHYVKEDSLDFEMAVAMNRQVPPYFEHVLLPTHEDAAAVTIKSIGPSPVDARLVRISYSLWYPGQDEANVSNGWWDIEPRFDFGVVAAERHFPEGVRGRTTVEYQTIDGRTAPKTRLYETFGPEGVVRWRSTSEITSCEFGPPPPEVFELSSYGGLRLEDAISSRQPPHGPERVNRKIGPAAWTAFGWTIATLLVGSVLPIRRAFGYR